MKIVFSMLLLLCIASAGCSSSKAKSKAQMERAYSAGLQAGKIQAEQQTQSGIPQVKFYGPVKNQIVPWTDGMTLAGALLEAQYMEQNTPRTITIYRNGQPLSIDPQRLIAGQDYQVFPGDMVVIQN